MQNYPSDSLWQFLLCQLKMKSFKTDVRNIRLEDLSRCPKSTLIIRSNMNLFIGWDRLAPSLVVINV